MRIKLFGRGERARAFRHWEQLESSVGDVPVFASRAWVECWLDTYRPPGYRVAIGFRGQEACAAALLVEGVEQKRGPLGVRTVHIGTTGEADQSSVCVQYNDVLAHPDCRGAFLHAVFDILESERGWEEVRLDGFCFESIEPALQHRFGETRVVDSHYFDLKEARANQADPLALLSRKARKQVRRAERAYQNVSTEWAEGLEQALSFYRELIEIHTERWRRDGRSGCFDCETFTEFHERAIRRLWDRGEVGLFRVTGDGETLGVLHMFIDRGRVLSYQSGLRLRDDHSVGMLVDSLCQRACLERGYDAYDFLAGTAEHKRRMSTHARKLVWGVRVRPSLKVMAVGAARFARAVLRGGRAQEEPTAATGLADELN